MQLSKWIIIIVFLVLCGGCIEPFEPEIEEKSEVLVIDGKITDSGGIQTIIVSKSSPYNSPRFQAVSGCVVRVEDDSGKGITFLENEDGEYQAYLEPDFMTAGKAYKLLIFTPDELTYESDYDSLLMCAPIESLNYKVEVQPTSNPKVTYYGIRFFADVKGSMEDSRNYMWTFKETWEYIAYHPIQYIWDGSIFQDHTPFLHGFKICYLTSLLENFEVGSSSLMGSNEIRQQALHFVSNQTPRLQEKYSLLISQHSLSHDAFLYWEKMRAQAGDTGGLFETQPSSSRGNIYNINDPDEKVLGYFFASQVQEKRITVSEDFEFPITLFDCPLDTVSSTEYLARDYPYYMYSLSPMGRGSPYAYSNKECHDCTYRGGVTTKPEYWDD
ncbi:MAG: DUF4249 domain-containing protein [Bacteroidales bacterium]|nr:DUF4249 domain-containing protein [Bacteroidales bacterium]